MTNFDAFNGERQFKTFVDVAISAERIFSIDVGSCAINCRRAMEIGIKWMYSVDKALAMPWQDNLITLLTTSDFQKLIDPTLYKKLDFIRRIGNQANHGAKPVTREQVPLCLENLFDFFDFLSCCYGSNYQKRDYNKDLLKETNVSSQKFPIPAELADVNLMQLIEENKALKEQLSARRKIQVKKYVVKAVVSEFQTRKIYIDTMLNEAGWREGENWINEYPIDEMPNASGKGFADYVLLGDSGKPLALIEAKKTCVDVSRGRQQAELYANFLEKKFGRRPVIFLSNGFETRIIDGCYPERKCASVYSKRDLEKWFNLQKMRTSLANANIDKSICGRYYQEGAIKAVCETFQNNRRRALLVMATGSGKTRTVIGLCKVLLDAGWIKNVLFLADRTSLVIQAKRAFTAFLPNVSNMNLCEEKNNDFNAHVVLSTYQTIMNKIDSSKDEEGKVFTSGHFDLIICDEAHRSIYNKYQDIFNYFDSPLVGLTATPKDEIDKNTYQIFQLENGVPTYGYDLAQAVKDGYLVDFVSIETKLKFLEDGIVYDQLSDEEKEEFEETFAEVDGEVPDKIESSALNQWVFNEDTIRKVFAELFERGLKIDYGQTLGKTIIFAKNHKHAEKVLEVFNQTYPELAKDKFAKVIDNQINYAQTIIDEFSAPKKMPQIAISVDMLDTGIDVPEILNLVFFKKVMSKAKFWQMIGRGTRLCEGLVDGENKSKFYIFDFCGNFDFFRLNKGSETPTVLPLQSVIFHLKFQLAFKLQDAQWQKIPELSKYREELVQFLVKKVKELDDKNFAVHQHIEQVEKYRKQENYAALTYEETLVEREEVAPLILPDKDNPDALRFDALMYSIELGCLASQNVGRQKNDLIRKADSLSKVASIPEVKVHLALISAITETDYLEKATVPDYEKIRVDLRDLIKYIPRVGVRYDTDFTDEVLEVCQNEAEYGVEDSLRKYKERAEFYIRQHMDDETILRVRSNVPLRHEDIVRLEGILWDKSKVGTKDEYDKEYGAKPLGEFIREIVGLDMKAAKSAFADFLDNNRLSSEQIYFVNEVIEYIVKNGVMKDFKVMQDAPFNNNGSLTEVFKDITLFGKIKTIIKSINENALAA